jgi:anti-sigma regulatory factor (Ser/Thr protein kinase)/anti-anti-sigma regulatory factor
MESEFQIVADADRRTLVVLRGVVDARNATRAREAIRRAAWPGPVSVDVGGLSEIDNSGVRALIAEAVDARRAGWRLHLRGAHPRLMERLHRNGLWSLFGFDSAGEIPFRWYQSTVRIVWKEERFQTPAEVRYLPEIRHRVTRFCRALGVDRETLDNIHLGAGEAVTNAIRHGCCDNPTLLVEVRCAATDDRLVVEVHDPGTGFDPGAIPPPAPDELRPGGMGIYLMRAMLDDVEFSFADGGTMVRLVQQLNRSGTTAPLLSEGGLRGAGGELNRDE